MDEGQRRGDLRHYGQAVHAASALGPLHEKVDDAGATLYLHVFNWPKDGTLSLPGLKNVAEAAYLLADAEHAPLKTAAVAGGGVTIELPASTGPDFLDHRAEDPAVRWTLTSHQRRWRRSPPKNLARARRNRELATRTIELLVSSCCLPRTA